MIQPDISLPPINNSPKDTSSKHQRKLKSQGNDVTINNNKIQQTVDEKLHEQFRYFRLEYIEAANLAGIAIPLQILEDKSGQVYKFVYNGGPKYLFDIIIINLENIHILRCSLSLLIIIITILRRKLPTNSNYTHNTLSNTITAWVIDALAKIGDHSSVSACITVLISSYNPSIQELSLSLLASILMVSDEAVTQMLQESSNFFKISEEIEPRSNSKSGQFADTTPEIAGSDPNKYLSYKPKIDFKKLNYSYNTMDYSTKKVTIKKQKKIEKSNSCLSYVLSMVLLQKNRHLLIAGCADVILAILRNNTSENCLAIAKTSTCALPTDENPANSDNRSKGLSKYSFNSQTDEELPVPTNPLSNAIIEWAGLKILLKFLFRYENMSIVSKSASATAIARDSVSASLKLKEEYKYAHRKAFIVICELISGSYHVASYAYKLPGAKDLITITYSHIDENDFMTKDLYTKCMNAFMFVKQNGLTDGYNTQDINDYGKLFIELKNRSNLNTPKCVNQVIPWRTGSASNNSPNRNIPTSSNNLNSNRNTPSVNSRSPMNKTNFKNVPSKYIGTPSTTHNELQQITLVGDITMNFESKYQVETEKGELYLINSYDNKYKSNSSDMKERSKTAEKEAKRKPLSQPKYEDILMNESLEHIGVATNKPILAGLYDKPIIYIPNHLMDDSDKRDTGSIVDTLYSTTTNTQLESKSNHFQVSLSPKHKAMQGNTANENEGSVDEDSDYQPINTNKDFFGKLPPKPYVPLRIEAKDVIKVGEDLNVIRKKFQDIAQNAIKQSGHDASKKGSQSQYDRMTGVYGPKEFHFVQSDNFNRHQKEKASKESQAKSAHSKSVSESIEIHEQYSENAFFSAFQDEHGNPIQDRPIYSAQATEELFGGALHAYGGNGFLLEGIDSYMNEKNIVDNGGFGSNLASHTSFVSSEGPQIYGLRLENFDFDDQNLFEGFKPIFGYPNREPSVNNDTKVDITELQETFDSLNIGKNATHNWEIANSVDLILP